ncbi:MAG: glycosyltransferase family 39 protein [Flavobacteriales bacterium]|nr:glycosyltransferase family 39 protein [Flavobacteriales bacterium]
MFDSYFTPQGQGAIAASVLCTVVAMAAFIKVRDRLALIALFLGALILRMLLIQLDPFLHTWDEVVHAVVAKNMAVEPLRPMLFTEPLLASDHTHWTENHIWLHKQPFFLWCMALSIKFLGSTVLAVRLPGALMTTLLVFFTHGMARMLYGRSVAFAAAVLMTWAYWPLKMMMGAVATDHNDVFFLVLIAGSFWAWLRYQQTPTRVWVVAIGVFAGLAVLTKWLLGLLVFGGWACALLAAVVREQRVVEQVRHAVFAFGITAAISLPWQLYTWLNFPVEMAHEQAYNWQHIIMPVEGHRGAWDFHFKALGEHLYPLPLWIILGAFAFALFSIKDIRDRVFVGIVVVAVHLFFGLSATKMVNYTVVLFPLFLIALAWAVVGVVERVPRRSWRPVLVCVALVGIGSMLLQFERVQLVHTAQSARDPFHHWYRSTQLHNLGAGERLAEELSGSRPVVFNVPFPANLSLAFFQDIEASTALPTSAQVDALRERGYDVVVVDPPWEMSSVVADKVMIVQMEEHAFKWL